MPRETLVAVVTRVLRERRTATTQELVAEVVAAGATRAADPAKSITSQIRYKPAFHEFSDGQWILRELSLQIPATHRLTAEEIRNGALAIGPDMAHLATGSNAPLLGPTGPFVVLHGDAAVAATGLPAELALVADPGWFTGEPGDLVVIRPKGLILRATPAPPADPADRMRERRLVEAVRRRVERDADDTDDPLDGLGDPDDPEDPVTVPAVLPDVLVDLLATEPDLFDAPLRPFGELFDGTGLETHGLLVGVAGTEWPDNEAWRARFGRSMAAVYARLERASAPEKLASLALGRERLRAQYLATEIAFGDPDTFGDALGLDEDDDLDDDDDEGFDDELLAALTHRFDLDSDEESALEGVFEAYGDWVDGGEPSLRAKRWAKRRQTLLGLLDMDRVAEAIALATWTDPGLADFVGEIESGPDADGRAGTDFVLGDIAERLGDLAGAEARYMLAIAARPHFAAARRGLARLAMMRGRWDEARVHISAVADADADLVLAEREVFAQMERRRAAAPQVGRNDRCPCGSGRKYKACHLGQPLAALDRGATIDLLLARLALWLERPEIEHAVRLLVREVAGDLTAEVAERAGDASASEIETELLQHDGELFLDAYYHEGGGLERFDASYGDVLPAADRALLRSWIGAPMRLVEIVSVTPRAGAVLRERLTDGATIDLLVRDPLLERSLRPGLLILGRFRPAGDGTFIGGTVLAVDQMQAPRVAAMLRSGDWRAILRWILARSAVPRAGSDRGLTPPRPHRH